MMSPAQRNLFSIDALHVLHNRIFRLDFPYTLHMVHFYPFFLPATSSPED